jgi:putative transposase
MRTAGLEGVSRRRFRVGTTHPGGEAPAAPDLVRRDFTAKRPDQLWYADITYVPTWQGWLYLAAVVDACSRYCVGWSMRDDLKADLVHDALGMAVTRRRPTGELVHHSDRGSQYRSLAYGKLLRESGIAASMGSRGDAYDNAAMESFMASIKTELINRRRFKTKDEARTAIFTYIEAFYNPRRRHSALGQKSPAVYEKSWRPLSWRLRHRSVDLSAEAGQLQGVPLLQLLRASQSREGTGSGGRSAASCTATLTQSRLWHYHGKRATE